MLPVYLAAMGFGLVLIGASLFGGHGQDGQDGDASADLHGVGGHDGDAQGHDGHLSHSGHSGHSGDSAESALLATLLSLRFWTYALGAFGMAGAALCLLGLPAGVHVPVAVGLGASVGGAASWIFRKLRLSTASLPASEESLLGAEAEVVLPLLPGRLGKVRLRLADQDVEVVARGGEADSIEIRNRVVVVRFQDGVAEVRPAPWKE